jgi:LuxR family transcriptional regulator, quorum-sensing system regulator SolR
MPMQTRTLDAAGGARDIPAWLAHEHRVAMSRHGFVDALTKVSRGPIRTIVMLALAFSIHHGAIQSRQSCRRTQEGQMNVERENWWMDVSESLQAAFDRRDLFQRAARIAEGLGYPYSCYGMRLPDSATAPSIELMDSYPFGWMTHYENRKYINVDPTVRIACQENTAVLWSNRLFSRAPELWADAQATGLRVGIAQPSWAAYGAFGLFSLARDAEPISASEQRSLRPRLRWLADTTHQLMQRLILGPDAVRPPRLSAREQEVLSWTADGKTSWEVSQILSIAESTVNFHVKNIMTKLQVQNKLQAAAKASALGLFFT